MRTSRFTERQIVVVLRQGEACTAVGVARSTLRYKSRKPSQEPLRRRLRELASVRTYAGYRSHHC